jgi:hypothetical protein
MNKNRIINTVNDLIKLMQERDDDNEAHDFIVKVKESVTYELPMDTIPDTYDELRDALKEAIETHGPGCVEVQYDDEEDEYFAVYYNAKEGETQEEITDRITPEEDWDDEGVIAVCDELDVFHCL